MITHILSALPIPKGPHSVPVRPSAGANREFYTCTFVIGCAWLTSLIFFQGFRDLHQVLGVRVAFVLALIFIGVSAFLLR